MHHDTSLSSASSQQDRTNHNIFSLSAPRASHSPRRATATIGKILMVRIAIVVSLAGDAARTDAAEARDITIDVPAIEIKGEVLKPDILGDPWVPKTILSSPIHIAVTDSMLDAQRKLIVKTKGAAGKRAHQIKLAAMLYMEAHGNTTWDVGKAPKAAEAAQLTEASRVLEEVARDAGDNLLDEGVRRLLAACQLLLQDYPASEKTWRALLEENPSSKYRPYYRAWLAYALLKQSKNREALAAVAVETIDDSQPELAYVAAWARWRSHDDAGALKAIVLAEKNWQQFPCNRLDGICLESARNETIAYTVTVLTGRFDVPASQALVELMWVPKGESHYYQRSDYEPLQDLGIDGYGRTGRWIDAITALDKAVEIVRDHMIPKDRVAIRSAQAEFATRLEDPDAVAKYAAQAIDALAVCDESCSDKYKADTLFRLHALARQFYRIYLTSNDSHYYQPACDLYAMTMPLLSNGATHAQAEKEVALLGTTFKTASEGSGTHDKDVLVELLGLRDREIQACYEASLTNNYSLAGSIALELDADAAGAMKGVTAQPVGSVTELSAVASCIAEHAKQWRLPRRGGAGNTHIKLSYTLTPGGAKD